MLALGACTTKTVGTSVTRSTAPDASAALTRHGIIDGEVVIRFTPDGERAVAASRTAPGGDGKGGQSAAALLASASTSQRAGVLKLGVPSLDLLNVKYRATALVPHPNAPRTYTLQLAPDAYIIRAVQDYGADPLVEHVEPHYALELQQAPSRPDAVRTEVEPVRE